MTEQHTHEIDGKLHEDCPMCDLIRTVQVAAAREKKALHRAKGNK